LLITFLLTKILKYKNFFKLIISRKDISFSRYFDIVL